MNSAPGEKTRPGRICFGVKMRLRPSIADISPPPVGHTVVYARGFLVNIGVGPTSDMWDYTGKVVRIDRVGGRVMVAVRWKGAKSEAMLGPSAIAPKGSERALSDTPEYWDNCEKCGEPAQDRVKGHAVCPKVPQYPLVHISGGWYARVFTHKIKIFLSEGVKGLGRPFAVFDQEGWVGGNPPAGIKTQVEEFARAQFAAQRGVRKNPSVVVTGDKVMQVKNLGWLLKHWKDVRSFEVATNPDSGAGEALLIAHLDGGRKYVTDFADASVLKSWLDRPVFKGVPVKWAAGLGHATRENPNLEGHGFVRIHDDTWLRKHDNVAIQLDKNGEAELVHHWGDVKETSTHYDSLADALGALVRKNPLTPLGGGWYANVFPREVEVMRGQAGNVALLSVATFDRTGKYGWAGTVPVTVKVKVETLSQTAARKNPFGLGKRYGDSYDNDMPPRLSMTYGVLPKKAAFLSHFRAHVPEGDYRAEIKGKHTPIIASGTYDEDQLWDLLGELHAAWEAGDEKAGDWASVVLETLGIEWV